VVLCEPKSVASVQVEAQQTKLIAAASKANGTEKPRSCQSPFGARQNGCLRETIHQFLID